MNRERLMIECCEWRPNGATGTLKIGLRKNGRESPNPSLLIDPYIPLP